MVKKRKWRPRSGSALPAGEILGDLLAGMGGSPGRAGLAGLWNHWEEAMGAELAAIARPLGARGRLLLVGVDNSMRMLELQFRAEEVAALANSWLGSEYFENTRFSIFGSGKICRAEAYASAGDEACAQPAERAPLSGKYLKDMDKSSPVARCYRAFAKAAKKAGSKACFMHKEVQSKKFL